MRLHLGCGNKLLPAPWVNVDREGPVDMRLDLRLALPMENASVEWIYSSHMVEHFEYDAIVPLFHEWHRVLIPGGKATVATIDINGIYRNYQRHAGDGQWISPLFGSTGGFAANPFFTHRCAFDEEMLGRLMRKAGFASTRAWEPSEYPEIEAIRDYAVSARHVSVLVEGIA